jgi:TonB-dependent starch-binding outer membrane protein SusC
MKICLLYKRYTHYGVRLLNNFILTILFTIACSLITTFATAQTQTVTGKITSADGRPLSGASVEVKGTTTGTTTDANGNFRINAARGATLAVGYVGFANQEFTVGDNTTINITMQGANASLNEVVVIGYQAVRKKDLTGAAGVVDMTNANRLTTASVGEAIQGLVPGVTVRNTGAPGRNAAIEIRGVGSFGSVSPLYVIDGMLSDANTTINTDDIASIQVLKDASAAAIYGSRAGNGVIIITTKKGREGPVRISASAKYGTQQIPKKWDVMSASQFAKTSQTLYQNSNLALPADIAAQLSNPTVNTDWQDQVFQTGNAQDYNLTVSGGSSTGNFLISGSYYKNHGVLIANDFERASIRINTEARKGRLTIGENMVLSSSYGTNPGGGINAFYEAATMLPIIAPQGNQYKSIQYNPAGWGMGTPADPTYASNYVAVAALDKQSYNFAKVVGNVYADVKLTNWLNYRFNTGVEASFDYFREIRDTGIWRYTNQPPQTSINESRQKFTNFLLEHTLNFNKTFTRHSINGVIGFSRTQQRRDITSGGRLLLQNFGGQEFTTISSATGTPSSSGSTPLFWRSHGYLGRVNYAYNDRYLLTLTGRIDQDSRFGPNFRTGYFPSIAAAWRLSKESFFDVSGINDLKIRASYGKLGFSDILGSWDYIGTLNNAPRAIYGVGQTPQLGQYTAQLVNPDLHWETRIQKNLGFDATLLDSRLSVTFDVYNSTSKDVLVNLPQAFYLGSSGAPSINAASIKNTGVELGATYHSNKNSLFRWDVSGNFTTIKNKVVSVGNRGVDAAGNRVDYIEGTNFIRAQVGHAVGEWFVIKTAGIFKSQQEIDAYVNKNGQKIQPNAKPGDIKYIDLNGDANINNADRQYAGSPWPKLQAGAQFNGYYKNFGINLQLVGVFGTKIYNGVRQALDAYQLTNFRSDIDPWSTSNPNGKDPRLGIATNDPGIALNNMAQTDRWLESGAYVRVRNLEINYTLPKSLLGSINITSSRVYVSAQNLLTITKYKGLDPDVQGTSIINRGFDAGNWPASRVISVGINCEF